VATAAVLFAVVASYGFLSQARRGNIAEQQGGNDRRQGAFSEQSLLTQELIASTTQPVTIPNAALEPDKSNGRRSVGGLMGFPAGAIDSPGPVSADRMGSAGDMGPVELRRKLRDLWHSLPEVGQSPFEPVDRLAGGIRPLASTLTSTLGSTFAAALDAIWRSMPVMGETPPEPPPTRTSAVFAPDSVA
jgi:hypothetical protein